MNFPPSRSSSGARPSAAASMPASSSASAARSMPAASNFSFASVGLDQASASAIWTALRRAVLEIQEGNQGRLRFEELYRNAYTLVLHKHGDMLYRGVDECVAQRMQQVAKQVQQASDAYLLDALVSAWSEHSLKQTMLKDILMYMDKTYCKQMALQPVYERGVTLFREIVVQAKMVGPRVTSIMLDMVRRERESEVIDGVLLRNACQLLVAVNLHSLELYVRLFEADLLAATRRYYAAESQRLVAANSVPDYLRAVEARLLEEEARADRYFDPSTKPKLRAILQDELLVRYADRLVADPASGAAHMLTSGALDDMARMYSLFSREPTTLPALRDALGALVRSTGSAIVTESRTAPRTFVEKILECRSHFLRFVEISFRQDRNFARVVRDALEHAINLDSRAAQFLSLYTDDLLRRQASHASGGLSEQELDAKLNDILSIFRYLQDKDIFEEYYKQHLALRLLEYPVAGHGGAGAAGGSASSASADLERNMIAKLKAECGHQFTSKLEGMFRDMDLSRQLMRAWRDSEALQAQSAAAGAGAAGGCELAVSVLTTGFWPLPSVPACKLPPEHSGRKLTWQTSLGQAELRCNFEGGRRELVVHTYQMVILMLFNSGDKLSYAEIHRLTNIPMEELGRHLLSLAHPQVKILLKNPPGKALAPDHRFKFNTKYTSKLYRNKIALLSKAAAGLAGPAESGGAGGDGGAAAASGGSAASSASSSSASALPASILESRQFSVEASVVRIMKSRKTLEHSALLAEVTRQLSNKFPVEAAFVKKRIEALIEREYIERDPNNRRIYLYKA